MPLPNDATTATVRVWDLPTRLFHWALVVAIVGLVVTGNVGGNAMVWHFRLGLAVGALLLFRIVWGLVGGRWSRFASFLYAPGTILRYLRGEVGEGEHVDVGHNPLGSLSVLALLFFLALQVATGLVADDEIANTGPLNRFVTSAQASLATGWHSAVGKTILIVLVLLHVGAIVFYLRRRQRNLVRPMLTGDKTLPAGTPASTDTPAALDATREIFLEYAQTLGVDLCFQNFEAELAQLPGDYAAPAGGLLLAWVDGALAGCGAFRPLPDADVANACEMKRLYVRRAFRRFGLGRLLAQTLMDQALQAGYSAMLLDTLDDMEAARGLYAALGFQSVPPYYYNPIPGAHYLQASLG